MRRIILAIVAGLGLVAVGAGNADAARREAGQHRATTTRVAKAPASPARGAVRAAPAASRGSKRADTQARRGREVGARVASAGAKGKGASRGGVRPLARGEGRGERQVATRGMNRLEMRAVAANTCVRRDARGRCTGARLAGWGAAPAEAATTSGRSWHAGLPAPDAEQMACPEGTMATLARGHSDTIRCMPL